MKLQLKKKDRGDNKTESKKDGDERINQSYLKVSVSKNLEEKISKWNHTFTL